jgi:hypothetical protein
MQNKVFSLLWFFLFCQVGSAIAAPEFTGPDYLKASNTGNSDRLGYSVAISGDTAIVGAPGESGDGTSEGNNGVNGSGAAYIYVRSGDTWVQQAYLKAPNPGVDDEFGYSVAISGDTAIVGARFEDGSGTSAPGNFNDLTSNAGAAYVYVRNGGLWTLQAYLKADNVGTDGDLFGFSVGISGDTAIVGAYFEDGDATVVNGASNDNSLNSGAAYIFQRNGGAWTQQAYLKASNRSNVDNFGFSVALSGDTAVVGSILEDDLVSNSGAAYVFFRNNGVWSEQGFLKASNPGGDDRFGSSVAVSGDLVVVGAHQEGGSARTIGGADNDLAANAGAAYVFRRSSGAWVQEAYLKSFNADVEDRFGSSVAVSGDRVVVGAINEDGNSGFVDGADNNDLSNSGAAYVYRHVAGTWAPASYLKASNPDIQDLFGWSVGISGDRVIVATPSENGGATGVNGPDNNSASSSGAGYLFELVPARLSVTAPRKFKTTLVRKKSKPQTLTIANTGVADLTGISVAISGKGRKDFKLGSPSVRSLAGGTATSFSLTFKPRKVGRSAAVVNVSSSAGTAAFPLKGKGRQ